MGIAQTPIDVAGQGRNSRLASGTIFAGTKIFDLGILSEKIAVRKSRRDPDPFVMLLPAIGRHVVRDDFAEVGRSLSDIQDQIDHVSLDGPDHFPHVGIPLQMEPANRPRFGETFIGLQKFHVFHKPQERMIAKIALAKMLAEVAAMIAKPRKPNNLDFRESKGLDADNFQWNLLANYWLSVHARRQTGRLRKPRMTAG